MKTFVNLPVQDLARTTEFFTKIGFSFNKQFTDENATCMIISADAYAMLLVEPFFTGFTQQDITDTSKNREVIVGLSTESRQQVDDLTDKALAAGAQALGEPEDQDFMYMRGFRDLDGHQWSFLYMDMSAIPDQ
ncbi:MAG: VOC family protein [Carbonactinosporaceae bacterium]